MALGVPNGGAFGRPAPQSRIRSTAPRPPTQARIGTPRAAPGFNRGMGATRPDRPGWSRLAGTQPPRGRPSWAGGPPPWAGGGTGTPPGNAYAYGQQRDSWHQWPNNPWSGGVHPAMERLQALPQQLQDRFAGMQDRFTDRFAQMPPQAQGSLPPPSAPGMPLALQNFGLGPPSWAQNPPASHRPQPRPRPTRTTPTRRR